MDRDTHNLAASQAQIAKRPAPALLTASALPLPAHTSTFDQLDAQRDAKASIVVPDRGMFRSKRWACLVTEVMLAARRADVNAGRAEMQRGGIGNWMVRATLPLRHGRAQSPPFHVAVVVESQSQPKHSTDCLLRRPSPNDDCIAESHLEGHSAAT